MPRKLDFFGPTNQYVILTRLIRYGQALTLAEFKVLMFIYDRSLGFRKLIESIPYRHFFDGVISSNGDRITFGVGLGETALKKALRGLERKGVIMRGRSENPWMGTYYKINVVWCNDGIQQMWIPDVSQPDGMRP